MWYLWIFYEINTVIYSIGCNKYEFTDIGEDKIEIKVNQEVDQLREEISKL